MVAFGVGLLLYLTTWASVLATLVLPGRSSRLAAALGEAVRAVFLVISDRRRGYEAKDRLLAWQGPLILVAVLSAWLLLFFLSFALLLWPLTGGSFTQALTESGSSMLTLGFAATSVGRPVAVHFVAAATGLIVVALQIAYLPALYGAFNRRETLVTMLQSRAGSPAWGPEILARHQLVGITDNLPDFYDDWEQWAADVAESHANYPVLIAFRSPQRLRSWLVALLAVLDSAALYHSLSPGRHLHRPGCASGWASPPCAT